MRQKSVHDDVAKLQEMAREFTLGFNTRDVGRIMRFYSDQYVDVNLRNPVQTKAERSEYYRKAIERLNAHIDVQPDEIVIEGHLAFIRGTIRLHTASVDNASPSTRELRYLEVARRQPDGSWQVWWGMDGPVQEYDPGK